MSDINNLGDNCLNPVLQNPFNGAYIERVDVTYKKNPYSGEWYAYGILEFKKDNTRGTQRFDGKNFDNVVMQIKKFLTELP
jgi:hypothetical protein